MDIGEFEYLDGLLTSCQRITINPLNQNLDIWINTEDNSIAKISDKQLNVLSDFLDINKQVFDEINKELGSYAQELLDKPISGCPDLLNLEYRTLIIPKQNNTQNKYLFLLANTSWKIINSEFVLELEIMIKNNKFEFLQEYEGSWMFSME